jgi:hypothetical protein
MENTFRYHGRCRMEQLEVLNRINYSGLDNTLLLSAVSGDPCRRHSPGVMPK